MTWNNDINDDYKKRLSLQWFVKLYKNYLLCEEIKKNN